MAVVDNVSVICLLSSDYGQIIADAGAERTSILAASLLRGPLHGYAIIKRAEQLSDGRVRLATGTLYTALDRLTADGHVQLVSEETVGGRLRRTYGLTKGGAGAMRCAPRRVRMAEAARIVTNPEMKTARPASPGRKPRTA